jgi:hypothetical protein
MENLSFVQWQFAELSAHGVGTELQEYLNANGVTKDELVLEMEKHPTATVEVSIAAVLDAKAKAAIEVMPAVEEVAPVSEEASKLPSEDSAAE